MIFYYYFTEENLWRKINSNDKADISVLEPDELPMSLNDDLNRSGDEYIYISSMNGFLEDIIATIDMCGFDFIPGNPKIKQMKSHECKYLIGGDESAYNFTLKYSKSVKRIYNLDNILKMSWDKIAETFCGKVTKENTMLGCISAINHLNGLCKIKREYPCTITGYAKRVFQRTTGAKFLNNVLSMDKINGVNADEWFRNSYHGGFNFINRRTDYIEHNGCGIVVDANSLYPYIMNTMPLPCGVPHFVKGEPDKKTIREANSGYIYLFVQIEVSMKLKKDGIRCIKLNRNFKEWFLYDADYLEDTRRTKYDSMEKSEEYHKIPLTLNQSDYKLLLDNYDIIDIDYIGYVWQQTTRYYFTEYVPRLYKLKKGAQYEGERFCYKMLLNSVSGLMAKLPEYENIIIDIKDGDIEYKLKKSKGQVSYVNVGSAITGYGREFIIKKIKAHRDRWLYTDTDSIHLSGYDIPGDIRIGGEMGEFKVEKKFKDVIYFEKKNYACISEDDSLNLTMAGVRLDDATAVERAYKIKLEKISDEDAWLFGDELDSNDYDEINKGLCSSYGKSCLTDSELKIWYSIENIYNIDDGRMDVTYTQKKIAKNYEQMKTFEDGLTDILNLGTGLFPMTNIYPNGMFSTGMLPMWGDFSRRKKKTRLTLY